LLFEIWVFGRLKKIHPEKQFLFQYKKTDILNITDKCVIDAKYKDLNENDIPKEDSMQVFEYARKISV